MNTLLRWNAYTVTPCVVHITQNTQQAHSTYSHDCHPLDQRGGWHSINGEHMYFYWSVWGTSVGLIWNESIISSDMPLTQRSSLHSVYITCEHRGPRPCHETDTYVCMLQAILLMSVRCPPPCTHIFISMWLLELTGSLGECFKLKSSTITLKGTMSQLDSGWKGSASLIRLYMQTPRTENLCWTAAVKNASALVKTFLLQIYTQLSRRKHLHLDVSFCADASLCLL